MKLTKEERNFVDNIVAISALDKKSVKTFFRSLLIACTMSVFTGENEIYIPYICRLKIGYDTEDTDEGKKLNVNLMSEPAQELISEIKSILNDESPPSKKYLQKEIFEKLKNILEIEDLELDIED